MTHKTPRGVAALALALVLSLAGLASAQIDTASIVGTITDASGAVLPGVTVVATQVGTGTQLTAVTSDRGVYSLPNLKVGTYTVSAELEGFKRVVRQGVVLNVQERLEVNFSMELGAISEEVTVSGQTEVLQTQKADIGLAVTQRAVTDLPLLGRRYSELAFLAPGVAPAPAGISDRGELSGFNANGNFSTWNNYTLDGADNNSFTTNLQERSVQVVQPPVDALEEFRVQTRTYSAEFGRAAGAVINASIKQGTNSFKGNAYEFYRDERLNANRWENNRAGLQKPTYGQNIFGGTLGGPALRDRTFFFVSYQGTRTDREVTGQANVPTPLMRQGNLIELPQALLETTFAPGCVNTVTKVINAACLDPVAMGIMALYPQPNIPSARAREGTPGSYGVPNFINNQSISEDIDQIDVRVDQNLRSGRDRLFARYSYSDTTRLEEPLLGDPIASGDFNSQNYITGQSAVVGWTRVFGNSVVNEFRGSWNDIDSDVLHPAFGKDVNAQYGITGLPTNPLYSGGLPHLNIGGLTRIGGPFFRPQFQESWVWQFSDNLSWTKGSHEMKFGVERRRDAVTYIDLAALNGLMTFSSGRYTNVGIGDFLLGLASQQRVTLLHEARLYTDGWQFYGQDSWRATPSVTFNYGIRYEYFTPLLDRNNKMTNIDPKTGQTFTAKDGDVFERALIHPDRNNFAPRVGFTWRPADKLVLRGGFGVFYQHTDRYGSESQMALNPPQLADVVLQANSRNEAPAAILRNGFVPVSAANIDPARVQWRLQNPDQKTPVVQQFSIGPEYEVMKGTVLAVEYVGNRTRNGRRLRNLNQGIIVTPGVGPVVFPYAQYGYGSAYLQQVNTDGRTDYHSLQVRLQRRFVSGLAYTAQFTWSRALGDFLDHLSADSAGVGGNFPINVYDLSRDYGPLVFDVPRRFTASFIYELPFGQGRAKNPGGVLGAIVGNWNVNGIVTISDGRPFTITGTDRASTGSGRRTVANCIGDPLPDGFEQTIDRWFDTSAFADNTPFTYGNCGVNTVRGPGFKSTNFSLFRSIPIGSARRIELRWEVFNLFNNVNFNVPGANVATPTTFGRITSTTGSPREMQLAVKFYF